MIWGAILLAFSLWGFTFGWGGGNFWVKIGLSVLTVFVYSLFWQRPKISFRLRSLLMGILSAAVLYLIFFAGNGLALYLLPGMRGQVGGIYALGADTNRFFIFLLLFFITGPGEEIFWRGFLQARLMEKWGPFLGYVAVTFVYAGVHLFSANLILILAALVAGAFWGGLYLWRRDLLLLIVSHSVWSAVIFAIAPVR